MALVGWVDPDALDAAWFDAPSEPTLSKLLRVAHEVCLAYAPDPLPEPVPESYALAQELQVRHLFARSKAGNGDSMGPDGYAISTFPLVLEARNLIRPKRNPFLGVL